MINIVVENILFRLDVIDVVLFFFDRVGEGIDKFLLGILGYYKNNMIYNSVNMDFIVNGGY